MAEEKRVVLRHNAQDEATGRAYNAGVYEVVENPATRHEMDATFAQRAIDRGLAEEGEPSDEVDANAAAQEAAGKLGVDLASVKGTGAGGKIIKADVEKAAGGEVPQTPLDGGKSN